VRIAINTRFLLKDRLEGIGWFTFEVVKRLVEQHPEDEFIFLFDRPFSDEFIFGKNVKVEVIFPPARHPLLWYWWFEWSLPKVLRKHQPDVFLSPDNYLSLKSEVKTVLVMHDIAHVHYPEEVPFLARKYYNFFVPKFLNKAERIVTVSKHAKDDIHQVYNINPSKISVVCNGCKDYFKPISLDEKQKVREQYAEGEEYFFYIGAIHPRKNIHRLILAFDLFKKKTDSPIKLLLGGRFAWQTGEIKNAYERAEFKKDIVLLGYMKNEDLPKLMGAALALTYVSLFEGFGIPLLEAMHTETPVITSNVSSMPEVVGDAGLLVDPNSIESIANALEQIYLDEALRKVLVKKGIQQKEKFNWQIATDVVYKALQDTAALGSK
jgi:glycosyltransferase involved in cell wall biosynthesis